MIREAAALALPWCAVALNLPPIAVGAGRPTRISSAAVAFCLAIGASSLTALALIAMGLDPQRQAFVAIDAALWLVVGVLGWRARRTEATGRVHHAVRRGDGSITARARVLPGLFALTAISALAAVIATYRAVPHGEWDAWAIWNQHARFLFHGQQWRAMLSIDWSHPDYPLLLPASVARVWAYSGQETTLAPALVAMLFGAVTVTLVVTALDPDRPRAWIAGMLLLAAVSFLALVPSQTADVPLACFIVATLALTCGPEGILVRERADRAALAAGVTSALASWSKNEGVVFAAVMFLLIAVVAIRRKAWRPILGWVLGTVPVLVAWLWFTLSVAPQSSLFAGQSTAIVADRLLDLDRHRLVVSLMAPHLLQWGTPLAVAIVPVVSVAALTQAVARRNGVRGAMLGIIAAMFAAYYGVYVTSPFDIAWHVSTSVDRLIAQLWPALVVTAFFPDARAWNSADRSERVPIQDRIDAGDAPVR